MTRTMTIMLFLLFCAFAGAQEGTLIELSPEAAVSGNYIRLGDIASLSGENAAAIRRVFLGETPAEKTPLNLTAEEIMRRLRGLGLDAGVSIGGSDSVRIVRGNARPVAVAAAGRKEVEQAVAIAPVPEEGAQSAVFSALAPGAQNPGEVADNAVQISQEQRLKLLISAATREYLAKSLHSDDIESVVDVLEIRITLDPHSIEIDGVRAGELPGRAELMLLLHNAQGQIIGYGSALVNSTVNVTVPVLARGLRAGDEVARGDITLRKQRYRPGMPVQTVNPDEFISLTAIRALRAGSIVSPGDFDAPILVRKGQAVKVLVQGPSFSITEVTVAQSDGRKGDFIPVESVVDKVSYRVRVTGPAQADLPVQGR